MKRKRHLLLLLFGAVLMSFSALSLTSCDDDEEWLITGNGCFTGRVIPDNSANLFYWNDDNIWPNDTIDANFEYIMVKIISAPENSKIIRVNEPIIFKRTDLPIDVYKCNDIVNFRIRKCRELNLGFVKMNRLYPRYECVVEPCK